ncbi:TIGR03618 family F420-dependent PPOX class oxidoreductase [Micromonospora sp. NBC_00389]|uniref:pyridoxamine 5'-phosphate oxidase family protein n=1 Tax=Micromonospora sp. NBC_00389 TaxID=2903586 RepID=UPI002E1EC65B
MTTLPSLSTRARAFLTGPHVCTLTMLRPDGSPHVVAVRFTWDRAAGLARVLTVAASRKARNLTVNPGSRVAVCQVEGFRWLTLEGTATVTDDPTRIAEGVHRYTERYAAPPPEPLGRVLIEITATGSSASTSDVHAPWRRRWMRRRAQVADDRTSVERRTRPNRCTSGALKSSPCQAGRGGRRVGVDSEMAGVSFCGSRV